MSQECPSQSNDETLPVSAGPSTSNHHYLYQIQRQFSHQVNRNPASHYTSHRVSVVPDATSIVSSSSSSGNASNDVETATNLHNRRICCHWYEKIFKIEPDADKRLARSHGSFIIGRFLGVLSSISLLIGFCVKFFFINDSSSFGSIVSYIIILTSLAVFAVAAFLVIWATVYKSAKAREEFLESKHPKLTTAEPPFLKQLYKERAASKSASSKFGNKCNTDLPEVEVIGTRFTPKNQDKLG